MVLQFVLQFQQGTWKQFSVIYLYGEEKMA